MSEPIAETDVGFVGLGNMGLPMATNLVEAGVTVTGYDLDSDRLAEFEAAGGHPASGLSAVAANEVVLTSLRTPDQVRAVTDDLFEEMAAGSIFVDTSSIDPLTTEEVAEKGAERDVRVVDAPVSGGVVGAQEGTLSVIVGGDDEDVDAIEGLLDVLSTDVFRVGPSGAGQTVKLANQILVGAQAALVGETFRFGEANGIDPAVLHDVLSESAGRSWVLEEKGDRLVGGDFEPGFDIDLQYKDLRLAQEVAQQRDLPMYLLSTALEEYVQARREGMGDRDHMAMYELFDN